MPILAFDTSTPCARVAVLSDTGEILSATEKTASRHSSFLLSLCDHVLGAAALKVSQLRAVACGAGPGSFTGLRVGLAVAKGLALVDGVSLLLVPSLDALAFDLARAKSSDFVLPCIDAGKGQVYGRLYRTTQDLPVVVDEEDILLSPVQLCSLAKEQTAGAALLAGGNGVDRYAEIFDGELRGQIVHRAPGPSAISIGHLALRRLARHERDDLATSVPRYGRPPDITRPRLKHTTTCSTPNP